MNVRGLAILLWFLATAAAQAQGFAGLGQTTDGFALPDRSAQLTFPKDHGPHPEFRIEWWYVTANLEGPDGTPYGIQWTLFRNALQPEGKPIDQAWMAHAAVSTPDGHLFAERFARGDSGLADVQVGPFDARIDEWRMSGPTLDDLTLTAQGTDFHYELKLGADGPFVLQGDDGYSVKSETGQASHYYSQPFYTVTGTITLEGDPVEVTGKAWLDREWSSQPLTGTQTGWDWVSLHFDSGEKLMGYRLRDAGGSAFTVGTWITADRETVPLAPGQLSMTATAWSEVAGRKMPTSWDITLPEYSLSIGAKAIYPDSWMGTLVSYWEGPVDVTGSHPGIGYLEMSGY